MQAGVIAVQGTWPNTPPPSRTPRPPTASPRKWSRSGTRAPSPTATCSSCRAGVDDHLAADSPRGIDEEIREHVASGKPVLATCAGLIVCSRDAKDDRVDALGLVDVSVDRNAFGRQKDSFEAKVPITGLDEPFHAVFIRAPLIDDVGEGVETLATVDGRPVAVRDGPVVATAFHPELTDDPRIHDLAFFPEREVVA